MRANLPIGYTSVSQLKGNWFARLAVATSRISGRPTTFLLAVAVVLVWAITGAFVRLQRHLAARLQRGHDDHYIPDGLSDPGDAEPRHAGSAVEARRTDPGDRKCAKPHRRHRGVIGRRNRKSEGRSSRSRRVIQTGSAQSEFRHFRFAQVVDELRLASPGRVIEVEFGIDQPVNCDRTCIGQLLSNLLGNALTHGATGKPVVVHAERRMVRSSSGSPTRAGRFSRRRWTSYSSHSFAGRRARAGTRIGPLHCLR